MPTTTAQVKWTSNFTFPHKMWHRAQTSIYLVNNMKIIIRATHLGKFFNYYLFNYVFLNYYLAATQVSPVDIDDISFTPGQCPPPINCDFNTDMCGWVKDLAQEWIWDHGIGRLENAKVLPTNITYAPNDRTNPSSGMFMYTDFSTMPTTTKKVTMVMSSEFIVASNSSCLSFYYLPLYFSVPGVQFRVVLQDTNGNSIKTR
jgi:hypothetical protein